ncbi:hypothetical protein DTO271D3_604 [Paecilomyces variotii]|nr:hypothetical protein DTO169E5_2966 [Paecilomyces variotii]KAJ9319016.1 hypothetical protein DTO271D3_604 [Paecilomyces variotii]
MGKLVDSMLRLCPGTCASSHLYDERLHLPLILVRATHEGSPNHIPPTSQLDPDGSMWPRHRIIRPFDGYEVDCHLDKYSQIPTQFLSFTTWYHLRSRIETWKKAGVQNIRVHFVLTTALPDTTEIYRATGLIENFQLQRQPWNEEEYLLRGSVGRDAIIFSLSGDGEDILAGIPLFGFRYKEPILNCFQFRYALELLPTAFFHGGNDTHVSEDELRERVREFPDTLEPLGNENALCRLFFDALTRGKFFTVKDFEVYRGEIGL